MKYLCFIARFTIMGGISVDVTVEYTTVFSMDREWSMETKINGVRG